MARCAARVDRSRRRRGRRRRPHAAPAAARRAQRSPLASDRAARARWSWRRFIALFPIVWVVLSSFKPGQRDPAARDRALHQPDPGQLPDVLTETDFPTWFLNSVIVAAFTMVIGIAMSATTGYALSRFNFPGKRGADVGLPAHPDVPGGDPDRADLHDHGEPRADRHQGRRWSSPTSRSRCRSAPGCCGATSTPSRASSTRRRRWTASARSRTFWRVVLPLARPGLAVTAFYTFLTAWGEVAYAIAFIQTEQRTSRSAPACSSSSRSSTPGGSSSPRRRCSSRSPPALVFFFAQRHLVAGLTAGGTKG